MRVLKNKKITTGVLNPYLNLKKNKKELIFNGRSPLDIGGNKKRNK